MFAGCGKEKNHVILFASLLAFWAAVLLACVLGGGGGSADLLLQSCLLGAARAQAVIWGGGFSFSEPRPRRAARSGAGSGLGGRILQRRGSCAPPAPSSQPSRRRAWPPPSSQHPCLPSSALTPISAVVKLRSSSSLYLYLCSLYAEAFAKIYTACCCLS